MARAERFLQHVHTVLAFEISPEQPHHLEAALTAVWGAGRDIFFAHVGHTRAYLYRDGQLFRLTRDHTMARELEAPTGPPSHIDFSIAARDFQHVLTRALGAEGDGGIQIDLERFRLDDEDLLLVCSNGVTDALRDREIAAILKSRCGPADLCVALVERAQELNGEDDATALIGRYHIPRVSDGERSDGRPPR
jgi:protein phosphatase